ncbi:MAG: Bax inhibitor-1/YccA family protein [Halofilum sp. (in: g-proteobacteria)]|nr:Bax inhibitor-1/YccA family protein [Halofilum sp. (in: g-proteobacteria)]
MNEEYTLQGRAEAGVLQTNKVIRNTYMLLSMTLLFSALTAGASMMLNVGMGAYWLSFLGGMALLFVIPRFANSAAGIGLVFAFTGLLGFGVGPIIGAYVAAFSNGAELVMTALGGTGVIFLGLSAYALTTKKDFSFMGGFLMVGILVAFLAGIGAAIFGLSTLSLVVSAMFVLLMSGMILYQTSAIIHGGETNYVLATISLYVSIYNLFLSLLHLLAAFAGER